MFIRKLLFSNIHRITRPAVHKRSVEPVNRDQIENQRFLLTTGRLLPTGAYVGASNQSGNAGNGLQWTRAFVLGIPVDRDRSFRFVVRLGCRVTPWLHVRAGQHQAMRACPLRYLLVKAPDDEGREGENPAQLDACKFESHYLWDGRKRAAAASNSVRLGAKPSARRHGCYYASDLSWGSHLKLSGQAAARQRGYHRGL